MKTSRNQLVSLLTKKLLERAEKFFICQTLCTNPPSLASLNRATSLIKEEFISSWDNPPLTRGGGRRPEGFVYEKNSPIFSKNSLNNYRKYIEVSKEKIDPLGELP